mmetsp:Transcript_24012/g.58094  ORF Transcript_24012/g.58094 Transcript_24012/m.58094 type:complete len:106 (-) Transcript_24012:139-456(-)
MKRRVCCRFLLLATKLLVLLLLHVFEQNRWRVDRVQIDGVYPTKMHGFPVLLQKSTRVTYEMHECICGNAAWNFEFLTKLLSELHSCDERERERQHDGPCAGEEY